MMKHSNRSFLLHCDAYLSKVGRQNKHTQKKIYQLVQATDGWRKIKSECSQL